MIREGKWCGRVAAEGLENMIQDQKAKASGLCTIGGKGQEWLYRHARV